MVDKLPVGARLIAIMDCCHSGTGMDLPYERTVYETSEEEFDKHTAEQYEVRRTIPPEYFYKSFY